MLKFGQCDLTPMIAGAAKLSPPPRSAPFAHPAIEVASELSEASGRVAAGLFNKFTL